MMTGFNYLDRFNFPGIERDLVPLARERGTGLLAMKALADGYLYRSRAGAALCARLPVASVVVANEYPRDAEEGHRHRPGRRRP